MLPGIENRSFLEALGVEPRSFGCRPKIMAPLYDAPFGRDGRFRADVLRGFSAALDLLSYAPSFPFCDCGHAATNLCRARARNR